MPLRRIFTSPVPTCQVCNLGVIPYALAWQWQQQLVAQHRLDPHYPDTLLLLEHPPVYTLGQGATVEFLKFNPEQAPAELYRVERGGEVTYHCPGQLVGYPILNLTRHHQDLHWYLRQLEEVLIRLLRDYGLAAERLPGLTGVWVEGYKLAALGIKVSRWVTMHGFALNVCPDLHGFSQITPCGIADRPVGSLAQFLPQVSLAEVRRALLPHFASVFNLEMVAVNPISLEASLEAPVAPVSNAALTENAIESEK